jgi:hypothetical protein
MDKISPSPKSYMTSDKEEDSLLFQRRVGEDLKK